MLLLFLFLCIQHYTQKHQNGEKQGRPRNTGHGGRQVVQREVDMEGGGVSPTADQVHTEREFITGDVFPGSSAYHTNNRGDLRVLNGNTPGKKKWQPY